MTSNFGLRGVDRLDGGGGADIVIFANDDNVVIDVRDTMVADPAFASVSDWMDEV